MYHVVTPHQLSGGPRTCDKGWDLSWAHVLLPSNSLESRPFPMTQHEWAAATILNPLDTSKNTRDIRTTHSQDGTLIVIRPPLQKEYWQSSTGKWHDQPPIELCREYEAFSKITTASLLVTSCCPRIVKTPASFKNRWSKICWSRLEKHSCWWTRSNERCQMGRARYPHTRCYESL